MGCHEKGFRIKRFYLNDDKNRFFLKKVNEY